MRTSPSSASSRLLSDDAPTPALRKIRALLTNARHGTLTLQSPDGQTRVYGAGQAPHAMITVHDAAVFDWVLKSGDIGFAEAYIQRLWSTPDLSLLLQWALVNRRALEDVIYGHWWGRLFYLLRHWSRRNTRANSERNIHAHYDLGNAFYRLWLDPSMNYSSAWFQGDTQQPLQQAQRAKMARALEQAGVRAGHGQRVLEIGCGDGTFLLSLLPRLPEWRGTHIVLLDKSPIVTTETMKAFAGAGRQVEVAAADVFDYFRNGPPRTDAVVANLFLHHFESDRLGPLFGQIAESTSLAIACEPRRTKLSLRIGQMAWLIGFGDLTCHDVAASVWAGFKGRELSDLWAKNGRWQTDEYHSWPFTHCFVAQRAS